MGMDALVVELLAAATNITKRLDRSLSDIKGISFSEFQLLDALRSHARATATRVELADDIGLTPSGVTRALKPLERLGFVETKKDERDARRSLASLTPAGIELVADASGVVNDSLDGLDVLQGLSASDRKLLSKLLDRLAR